MKINVTTDLPAGVSVVDEAERVVEDGVAET